MRYQVDWYSSDLVQLGVLQSFVDLTLVRTENTVGSLKMTLAQKGFTLDSFKVGQYLEVWRERNGVLTLFGETAYIVQDFKFYSVGGEHLVDVLAKDLNFLLQKQIVASNTGSEESVMEGYADDMMKKIVRHELGPNAEEARRIPGLMVPAAIGQSTIISLEVARATVLDVLQDMANAARGGGVYTSFDLVRTNVGAFEFRTYVNQRGTDHSRASGDVRLVGEAYGNLEDPQLGVYHSDEWNFVYCGGKGEGDERIIRTAWDSARIGKGYPYNRKEYWRDARSQDDADGVQTEANAALAEGKPKTIMTGKLIDTPGMQFGRDYQFGDVVSAEAFNEAIDCHVSNVAVQYSSDKGEVLDVSLRGERE